MTQYEGIRQATYSQLEDGLSILAQQMRQDVTFSPLWKASAHWINCTYAEIRRRESDDFSAPLSHFTRDYGDEIEDWS